MSVQEVFEYYMFVFFHSEYFNYFDYLRRCKNAGIEVIELAYDWD